MTINPKKPLKRKDNYLKCRLHYLKTGEYLDPNFRFGLHGWYPRRAVITDLWEVLGQKHGRKYLKKHYPFAWDEYGDKKTYYDRLRTGQ